MFIGVDTNIMKTHFTPQDHLKIVNSEIIQSSLSFADLFTYITVRQLYTEAIFTYNGIENLGARTLHF
uniref:Putative ovule protein n=1 Tax=Solanum chacoense TaxID=4108 RepID=A0A0V0HBC3_SOLCH